MGTAKTLENRLYNVSKAAEYLLNDQNSLYLRAIRLYEMQIAVFFGQRLNERQRKRKNFPNRWVSVSSNLLAAARVCSAIRLLQHISNKQRLNELVLPSLLDDLAAREVLGRVLEEPVGLRKLAIALRPRSLDAKLRNRRSQQQRYAPIYDVSLRWQLEPGVRLAGRPLAITKLFKQKQGTEAHAIIRRYYSRLGGKSRTLEIADKDHFLAAFVWINQYSNDYLRPRRVEPANFSRKLLNKAGNIQNLKLVFGQYEAIRERLSERGYTLLSLDLGPQAPPQTVIIEPLADELVDAIETIPAKG